MTVQKPLKIFALRAALRAASGIMLSHFGHAYKLPLSSAQDVNILYETNIIN
jgi:hypothetical protein